MKKYRSLLITLGVIVAVVLLLVVIGFNLHNALLFFPVSTISDDSGGTIIAWQNNKGIYVQHIDSSGKVLWQKGGLSVTNTGMIINSLVLMQTGFTMVSDGLGGAIVAWAGESTTSTKTNNRENFAPLTIYMQRISSTGKLMWQNTVISTGNNWQIVSNGDGGAIIAWDNFKPYYEALHDDSLCLQKIAPDGALLWGSAGLTLVASSPFHTSTAGSVGIADRAFPTYTGTQDIVTDGDGGVIVIWEEEGGQDADQVFAQRVNSKGNSVWSKNTLVGTGTYQYNSLRTDGSDGAFLALQSPDQGVTYQERVGQNGGLLGLTQYYTYSVSDGSGGNISVSLVLVHPVMSSPLIYDILNIQRSDSEGSPVWPEKQVFSSQLGYEIINLQCTTDDNGGIFLTWQIEKGDVAHGIIYVQRVDTAGNILFGDAGTHVFGTADTYQGYDSILSDNSGGIFVVAPIHNGAFGGNRVSIQHIGSIGNRLWGTGIRLDQ
jgi:hypothetical protein